MIIDSSVHCVGPVTGGIVVLKDDARLRVPEHIPNWLEKNINTVESIHISMIQLYPDTMRDMLLWFVNWYISDLIASSTGRQHRTRRLERLKCNFECQWHEMRKQCHPSVHCMYMYLTIPDSFGISHTIRLICNTDQGFAFGKVTPRGDVVPFVRNIDNVGTRSRRLSSRSDVLPDGQLIMPVRCTAFSEQLCARATRNTDTHMERSATIWPLT